MNLTKKMDYPMEIQLQLQLPIIIQIWRIRDYFIKAYGMVPESFTKTYTVEGLDSYVMSLDQITKESLKAMQTQAEAVYYEDVENYWEDDEKLISFNYLGSYLLTKKDKDQYLDSMNNGLYIRQR